MSFDPYQILGVAPGADDGEIRRAYRGLARRYHPDVNPSPEAEERFKHLARAYSVLSDRERRALFDEFGEVSLSLGFNPRSARARAPGASRHRAESSDLHRTLEIDLATALRGGPLKIPSPRGTLLTVKLPAGVETGHRLRLRGRGSPGRDGGRPGDLYLEVQVLPHPYFRREGANLVLDLPVTVAEAWRGAEVEIPTLEGWVRLTVPPGSRGGERLRLRGKGLTAGAGQPGDLLVHLCLRLPAELQVARRSLERLAALTTEDVRPGLRL